MRTLLSVLTVLAAASALSPAEGLAQRGVGRTEGIAQQAELPEVVTLEGALVRIESGPCEQRVGPPVLPPIGTHIFIETTDGQELNVHLGPARLMQTAVKELAIGQEVTVTAFRTEAMNQNHYVAQTISAGGEKIELRDEWLRPVWAGGRGRGFGPGRMRGRGRGPGWGW